MFHFGILNFSLQCLHIRVDFILNFIMQSSFSLSYSINVYNIIQLFHCINYINIFFFSHMIENVSVVYLNFFKIYLECSIIDVVYIYIYIYTK